MKPLPAALFTLRTYKQLKVYQNGHIKSDGVYYSVPYQYIGQHMNVKISKDELEICDRNNRHVYTHSLENRKGQLYVTVEEHLKSCYQIARQIEARGIHHFYDKAGAIGPDVRRLLERLSSRYLYEEQAFGSCEGILHACDGYPRKMVNEAAVNCLDQGRIGYKSFNEEVKRLARENRISKTESKSEETSVPRDHANIRGKDYYK